ncbi:hypothetical protein [Nocardia takedensis]|uniref:hypothetical protein n=1 Tax=Nocardia takedensis TaxID=259390 RepID=UPI0002E801CD|nr:hypothetical protein [Nocardia takedensis]
MSERSVEDEITATVRQFGSAMRVAMQQHATATNWLERRRARKQISRILRDQRREEQQARTAELGGANQAVERYRVHSLTVQRRANDPNVDHVRRARDTAALREHRDALAGQVLGAGRLTPVERGIALDGLDAATAFPEFRNGDLFVRAGRVKGVEALRYRARVARESTVIAERNQGQREQHGVTGHSDERRRLPEEPWLRLQIEPGDVDLSEPYYTAAVNYEQSESVITRQRPHRDQISAATWMREELDQAEPAPGTEVSAFVSRTADGREEPVFERFGRAGEVRAAVSQWHAAELDQRRNLESADLVGLNQALSRDLEESDRAVVRVADERNALQGRLNLSIEHNNSLTEQHADLTQRLTATTAQRDQQAALLRDAVAERDRLRGERDEAVQRLAQRTPPAQRYGSPERQAEAARGSNAPLRTREPAREQQESATGPTAAGEVESEDRAAVVREITTAYTDQRSAAVRQFRGQFDNGTDTDQARDAFMQWWINGGGQDQYHAEQRQRLATEKAAVLAAHQQQGRSALADHQPGRTLADAVARNGADREHADEREGHEL